MLKGKKVHGDVRCIIIPGTQQIYMDALKEGLIEIFIEAGAAVSTPTCGPCLGGHMGVLAEGNALFQLQTEILSVGWEVPSLKSTLPIRR